MAPQLLSSVQVLYAPRDRAPIFGIVGAVSGLAAVIGPVAGGWLTTADLFGLGWRTVFAVNVPIGIAIVVAALRFVPNTTSPDPLRLDAPGVALATVGLFLVTFPLVDGREQGWPAWIWLMLAAGVAVLAAFARYQWTRERRDGSSLPPMRLFANRRFSAGLVTQFVFQGSMVGFMLVLTIYLQAGLRFSASVPLGTKLGKVVMFTGALLQAGATWWLIHVIGTQGAGLGGWDLTPPLAVAGFGLGLLVVPLVDVALATVDPADAGAASGAYGTLQQCGAAVGVAVVGVVFFHVAADTFTAGRLADALGAAGWVSVLGFLVCAAATLLLPSRAAVRAHAELQPV